MTARRVETRVEIRIDELVLDGVRPADAPRVSAALEGELARLVRDRGAPTALAAATADETPVEVAARHGEAPGALGTRLAGAIYRRLTP